MRREQNGRARGDHRVVDHETSAAYWRDEYDIDEVIRRRGVSAERLG